MLCSASDLPAKGFSNQIPLVARGNCTFYDKVRLAQGSGAHGLLIVSKETLVQLPGRLWRARVGGALRGAGRSPWAPTKVGMGAGQERAATARIEKFGLLMAVGSGLCTLILEGAYPRAVLWVGGYRASRQSSEGDFCGPPSGLLRPLAGWLGS